MAKKKSDIEPHELQYVKEREEVIGSIIGAIDEVSKFKKGDFLIAFRPASNYTKRTQITNSYGAPKKFMVVHTCKYGVPYMKELNKKGTPVGNLITPLKFEGGSRAVRSSDYQFEVDPDYADAIIMMDEDNYDAASIHRVKSDTFKAITDHNKSLKVNCHDAPSLIAFLQTLKVGTVIWKSIKTHWTVQTINPIPLTHKGTRIDEHTDFGTAIDSKGRTFNLNLYSFKWSAIYTDRPRSYRDELKDPK